MNIDKKQDSALFVQHDQFYGSAFFKMKQKRIVDLFFRRPALS